MEQAPNKKYKRLVAGGEVRLRHAYVIRCDEVIKNEQGDIIELHCSYDENTLGKAPEGRKVKGVIHWVSAKKNVPAEVRLYDRLFNHPTPDNAKEGKEFTEYLNPESLKTLTQCYLESSLSEVTVGQQFQFEREGYFCLDQAHVHGSTPVYNMTVGLRDSWAKIEQQHANHSS